MKNIFYKSLKQFYAAKRKDPYSVLGITSTATKGEIKKAFVKLTREFHPDRNKSQNAQQIYREITEAYRLLSSGGFENQKVKKEEYEYTQDFENFKKMWNDNSKKSYEDIFSDFDNFFNSNKSYYTKQKKNTPTKGENIEIEMKLTFMEAALGCQKQIQYLKKQSCQKCNGYGIDEKVEKKNCSFCDGTGYNMKQNGPFKIKQLCEVCDGDGKINNDSCQDCQGIGFKQFSETKQIYIPSGIQSGEKIYLKGEGDSSLTGGSPGDIQIDVYVYSHDNFQRKGLDIQSTINISVKESILGCEKTIETVQGFQKLLIEPCTQHGHIQTFEGEGIRKENQRGDHKVQINVILPQTLNKEQKQILEELRKFENKQFKFK